MSAWLPTAPCTPGDCVAVTGPRAGVVRRVLRLAGCLAVLVAGVLAAGPVRALAWLPAERLVRWWSRLLLAALGVRVRPISAPGRSAGGSLLVSNHVSWLDVLLVAAVRPGRMLAKTEVGRWPVLGPLTSWGGTIFIDRDRLRALPGTVEEIAAALRRGERVVVFPEGSTWCGRDGGRFRPALFEAAVRADVPVQPLTLRYRGADGRPSTAPAFVGEDGLLASLWRVVSVRGLTAEIELLPLLPPALFPGRRQLAAAAQRVVDLHRRPDGAPADAPGCAACVRSGSVPVSGSGSGSVERPVGVPGTTGAGAEAGAAGVVAVAAESGVAVATGR
ncbi:1-acyl-sn-glycerol-3-phosphate acyltransferase [Kitasatospora sp. SolWspMP-SS2h]|uniref:lysophospholipid acyltransferase family protein n=1 Tax=Kitasatospora sp. SolWspMP-SS2h TaxID=1305729 RepID=UPI000DBAA885|nr:lysophospholipid acyltransferase family protein [Kitasatospora sp. SolWspMP-SS2h]RAJ46426.1 1-acyl-sn-glycerol-3-phosphate acyltransferase [Kitasatospora sp. SolWspMP-SS2h]